MLALLLGASLLQGTVLGPVKVGDRDVAPALPAWPIPGRAVQTVESEGAVYAVAGGRVLRRVVGDSWAELPALLEKAKRPEITWKVIVTVSRASDELVPLPGGGSVLKAGDLSIQTADDQRAEYALFAHLVRAYTGGAVKVELDYEADPSPRLFQAPQTPDLGQIEGRATAAPRTSLFYVTPTTGREMKTQTVFGMPATIVPLWSVFDQNRPGLMARWLYRAWLDQVVAALADRGFYIAPKGRSALCFPRDGIQPPILESTDSYVSAEMWAALETDPSASHFPARKTEPIDWATARPRLWTLPLADAAALAPIAGVKAEDISPAAQGIRAVQGSQGTLLMVPADLISLAAAKISGLKMLAYDPSGRQPLLYALAPKMEWTSDLDALGLLPTPLPGRPVAVPSTSAEFAFGEAEKLLSSGNVSVRSANDPERGACLEFAEMNRPRTGAVRLLGGDAALGAAAALPRLELWVKAVGAPWPLDLVVKGDKGEARFRLFDRPYPGKPDSPVLGAVSTPASGQWNQISLDLSSLAGQQLTSVLLEAPSEGIEWGNTESLAPVIRVDDVKLAASGAASPLEPLKAAVPSSRSADPFSRLVFAAQFLADGHAAPSEGDAIELRGLLSDNVDQVRLNAASVMTRFKIPGCESDLGKLAGHFSPRLIREALKALAFQDSEAGWAAVKFASQKGPFDDARLVGSQLLSAKEKVPPASVTPLLTSQWWRVRAGTGTWLMSQDTEISRIVALTFLNEVEPAARLQILDVCPGTPDACAVRLTDLCATDPSDVVRGAAAAALARSDQPKGEEAARAAWGKFSWVAKASFLARVTAPDKWVPVGLADSSPRVRAAAASRATLANASSLEKETDSLVLKALFVNLKGSGEAIPQWLLDAARNSPDPTLRAIAGDRSAAAVVQ